MLPTFRLQSVVQDFGTSRAAGSPIMAPMLLSHTHSWSRVTWSMHVLGIWVGPIEEA